ncbi:MAG: hypothetical protein QGI21_01120 [Candidatus Poseidoniaceae archaeon]|nr:hypothetical protein [Candidatus Poseidoniaceae archaeon]
MEPANEATDEWEMSTLRSWMVEYSVHIDEEKHRHLSMISAANVSEVHHRLLAELRKNYHSSERIDVTVHRIEPVTTNTDALYFEGIYAP